MASKVFVSSTSANSDLTRQASIYSLTVAELQNSVNDPNKSLGSMSMDELVRNIWTAEESHAMAAPFMVPTSVPGDPAVSLATGSLSRQGSLSLPKHVGNKTVEEVWKEISGGGVDRKTNEGSVYKEPTFGEMTLEDFLAKAGIVREENVRIPSPGRHFPASQGGFPAESILSSQFQQQQQQIEDSMGIFGKRFGGRSVGNGLEAPIDGPNSQIGIGFGKGLGLNGEGPVRGKRRVVDEPVDKVAQQRQRRMIKNRESAARSRERKQAYTVELESLVTQLEEENAQLLRQQVEHTKKRLKQLMQNLIPIEEMRRPRPPRALRKTHSMNW